MPSHSSTSATVLPETPSAFKPDEKKKLDKRYSMKDGFKKVHIIFYENDNMTTFLGSPTLEFDG